MPHIPISLGYAGKETFTGNPGRRKPEPIDPADVAAHNLPRVLFHEAIRELHRAISSRCR